MDRVKIFVLPKQFHSDRRGWVFVPFQADLDPPPSGMDLSSLHTVRTEPGAVRGNHYHPDAAEYLHVFGGTCTFHWEEDGRVLSEVLDGDDRLIFVPAGTAHALENTGSGPVWLVALRGAAEAEPHTIPREIVGPSEPSP